MTKDPPIRKDGDPEGHATVVVTPSTGRRHYLNAAGERVYFEKAEETPAETPAESEVSNG